LDLAKSEGVPFYQINPTHNPSNEPRMAIGYSIIGQLVLAQKCGLLTFTETELKQLVVAMNSVGEADTQKMAKNLVGREIVFVSADFLDGAVHVWNNQTNENAKTFTSHVSIPELNHHLMESLKYPSNNRRELTFIFVNSQLHDATITKRFAITKEVVSQNKVSVLEFKPQSDTKLSQVFEVIQFGAYVAYYLSAFYKIDPAPIPWVDYFKKKMVEN
jgi:glucose/mannose-6-phosphate isomerase